MKIKLAMLGLLAMVLIAAAPLASSTTGRVLLYADSASSSGPDQDAPALPVRIKAAAPGLMVAWRGQYDHRDGDMSVEAVFHLSNPDAAYAFLRVIACGRVASVTVAGPAERDMRLAAELAGVPEGSCEVTLEQGWTPGGTGRQMATYGLSVWINR